MLVKPVMASSSVVEGPSGPWWRPIICLRQPLWKVSSCAPCAPVRAQHYLELKPYH